MKCAQRALAAACAALIVGGVSGCSRSAQEAYYDNYAEPRIQQGKFRIDIDPADAPYSDDDLFRNFMKIIFEPEEQLAVFYRAQDRWPRLLSKWRHPVRYAIEGADVMADDRERLAIVASELGLLTNLTIGSVDSGDDPNVKVRFLSEGERAALKETIHSNTWYQTSILRAWIEGASTPCFSLIYSPNQRGGEIQAAEIYIKSELPEPLRATCIIEEFTQALGPLFDHYDIRPSVFNDDQEFVALTKHDREIMQILYDERLEVGMSSRQAAPVARRIIEERRYKRGDAPITRPKRLHEGVSQ